MRLCFDDSPMEKPPSGLGLDLSPGGLSSLQLQGLQSLQAGFQGLQGLQGLHAALAPLGSLARSIDVAVPSPATLNLSVNLPLHVPQSPLPPYQLRDLKDFFLASLIRGKVWF